MFSKFIKFVAASAAVLTLAACDTKLGEDPPVVKSQEYAGASCLSKTSPVMKDYISGDAKDSEVAALWDCVSGAVSSFQRYVRGSSKDRYSSQEIATFLEQNFLDPQEKTVISPSLQLEFMKLKQLFVGGDRSYITQKELDKAKDVFRLLKTITIRMNPYMKVMVLQWSVSDTNHVQKDMIFFEQANGELQNSARALADHIEENGQTYNLSDFATFLEQLSKLFDEKWPVSQTVKTYMPVVKKVKKALAGGNENSVAPTEWRRFALLGARGYVQFLRYHYFIQSVPETGSGYRLAYLSRTMEDLLSVFQDLVAEKPEGVVSRAEVSDLLETLSKVWPDFRMSSGLVAEAMKVKQLFFGGSMDSFTTNDFKTAKLKISRLKALIERFLPYYPIYGMEWDPDMYSSEESQRFFMDSQLILQNTGRELGSLFEGAYDLKNLVSLVREFEKLYPPKTPEASFSVQINRFLPLVIDTKNIVLGGNDSTLAKGSWSTLLSLTSRVYSDFLYYHYFVKAHQMDEPKTLVDLSTLVNQSLNIVRDVLVAKKGTQLKLEELTLITRRLVEASILPANIKADSVAQVYKLLLNNIMIAPKDRLEGYVPDAITMHSVELLRRELQIWLDTELFIAKISVNWKPKEGLRPRDMMALVDKTLANSKASQSLLVGLKEFKMLMATPSPMTLDKEGRLYISRRLSQVYDRESLSQLNLNRAMARIVNRAFAGDMNRVENYGGVTLEEVNAVFNQVRPFFIEMELLEPDNTTFGDARFRDANLFMPHADGGKYASFVEVGDLVGMIWSGVKINSMLTEDLHRACLANMPKIDTRTEVSVDCALRMYRDSMLKNMTATPDFLKYMKSIDREESEQYIFNMFKTSGYVPNKKKIARIADFAQVPHAVQYIEMLFTRFDENSDGYLTKYEALKAFPLFKSLLVQYAGDQVKEEDLPSVFMFLLRYGKAPTTLKEKLTFVLRWRGKPDNWVVNADRTKLAGILGYIADMANKASADKIPEISQEELDK